jgi:hypothetical protein
LEKICLEIDKAILAALPSAGLKAHGLCELVTKNKQVNPITCDIKRKQADIHDGFNGIFYHRFLSAVPDEDEDFSFGITMSDRIRARLRTFVAYKVHLGEEFIFDFIKAIPKKIEIPGYRFIHRSPAVDLNANHEDVYAQEYGNTNYEHHRTVYNINAIEYNMEFIIC